MYTNTNTQLIIDQLLDSAERALFKKLFYEGDISGFSSVSAAEKELCKLIANFTEDPCDIDAVFRKSALYRPNAWNFNLYGDNLINQALGEIEGNSSIPPFVIRNTINNGRDIVEHISQPLLAEWLKKNFVFRFVNNNTNNALTIYLYENGVYKEINDLYLMSLIQQEIANYNPLLINNGDVNGVFTMLSRDSRMFIKNTFNENENIINFQNGILHLDTMELKPHSPEYLTTIQIPCNWSGDIKKTPVFDGYLKTLTNYDSDLQKFLLQYMGVIISNIQGWRMKTALILVGKGNSGKTQIRRLTELLVGSENYVTIDLPDLETNFGPGDLINKRLAGCADMKFVSLKSLKFFKLLTGGDTVRADRKYRNAVPMLYKGLLWFCTNELPRFGGDKGSWVYDRFSIINCDNVIPEDQRDNHLLDKMYAEREGIITKVVLSLHELIDNQYRFVKPQAIINARSAYSKENNVVGRFFEECMESSANIPDYKCASVTRIHDVFCRWCVNNNNNHKLSFKAFKTELADYLETDVSNLLKPTSNGYIVNGYTLTTEADEHY